MTKNKEHPKKHIFLILCIVIIIVIAAIFIINFVGNKPNVENSTNVTNNGNGTSLDENTLNSKEASLENPGKMGEWTKIKLYGALIDAKTNKITNHYNDAYIRLNKMTRGVNGLKPYIDKYNKSNINNQISFNSLRSNFEYILLDYEIYLPKDFKTDEDITNINIKIKTVSRDGKDQIKDNDAIYEASYATLITEPLKANSILPGNVIKYQAMMEVSQYLRTKDYLFAIEYTVNGEKQYQYIIGNVDGKQGTSASV